MVMAAQLRPQVAAGVPTQPGHHQLHQPVAAVEFQVAQVAGGDVPAGRITLGQHHRPGPGQRQHQPGRGHTGRPLALANAITVMPVTSHLVPGTGERGIRGFGDLQREAIRICAEESTRDVLPQFQVVTEAGETRARADQHRRALIKSEPRESIVSHRFSR